jgi:hypothetical protein
MEREEGKAHGSGQASSQEEARPAQGRNQIKNYHSPVLIVAPLFLPLP